MSDALVPTLRVGTRANWPKANAIIGNPPYQSKNKMQQEFGPDYVRKVAKAAVSLRNLRRKVMAENNWSLRELYRSLELPGQNPLRDAHAELDAAVRAAYGMKSKDDPLAFLLALNATAAEREARGESITAPGLPPCVSDPSPFLTSDCIQPPQL